MAPYSKASTTLSHPGHHQTTSRWESNGLQSLLQDQKQRVDQASNSFLPPPLLSSKAPIIKPWLIKRAPNDKGNDTGAYSFFRHLNRNPVKKAPVSAPSASSDSDSEGNSSGSDSGSESGSGSGSDESGDSDSSNDSDGSGTEDGSDGDDDDDDDDDNDDDSSEIENESEVDSDEDGENKQHDSRHSQASIDFKFLNTKTASPKRLQRPQNKRPTLLPWESSTAGQPPAAITLPLPLPPKPQKGIEALNPVPAKPPESKRNVEFPWMAKPKSLEPKKIGVPPKPIEPEMHTTQSQYVPSKLARSKMAARPNLDDEAAFFKRIESRHLSKLDIDSISSNSAQNTKPQPRPPLPSQKSIQEATCRSWELLQKKNAKRLLNQSRAEAESKNAKRVKLGEANAPPPTKFSAQTAQATTVTAAAKSKVKALPIESDRFIIQYTVFETQRLPLPFDGQLRDKVLRRESFLDKHKANVFAARLMPKAEYVQSSAAIMRIESDYGKDDAERDGMFFGRVYYSKDGRDEIKFVYVDREKQQLGKMSVSDLEKEVSNRDLSTKYIDTFLAVRYDVFVVLRKAIQPGDGRVVVYKYDESEAEIRTREDVDVDSDEEEEQAKETEEADEVKESRDVDEEKMEVAEADEEEEEEWAESASEISEPKEQSQQSSLGSHFEHLLQGSYTTLLEANSKAIDAFEKWTRPPSDRPQLDSIIYYRDYIKPDLARRRAAFDADDGSENAEANKRDVESIELSWEPLPQFGYSYSSVSVVVTKSQMQGPLDLTGAFKGR